MPAKLLERFLKPIPETLEHMQPGSHAFIRPSMIWVDLDHSMYLPKCTDLVPEDRKVPLIKVNRDSQGAYHLDFLGQVFRREPMDISVFFDLGELVPVESFTE